MECFTLFDFVSDWVKEEINSITIKNFRSLNCEHTLMLKPLNIIEGLDDVYSDMVKAFLLLRGDNELNELTDFSLDHDSNDYVVSLDVTRNEYSANPKTSIGIRKNYRGKSYIGAFKRKVQYRFKGGGDGFDSVSKKTIKQISIYPNDFGVSYDDLRAVIRKVQVSYPELDCERYIVDVKDLVEQFKEIVSRKPQSDCTSADVDLFLDLILCIALEYQKKSLLIIFERFTTFNQLSYEMLDVLLMLLLKFPGKVMIEKPIAFAMDYMLEQAMCGVKQHAEDISMHKLKPDAILDEVSVRLAARKLLYRQSLPLFDDGRFDDDPLYVKEAFKSKVNMSMAIVEQGLAMSSKPAVATSFGKDSSVLQHLVIRSYYRCLEEGIAVNKPEFVFVNTRLEFPEHLKFARQQMKKLRKEGFKVTEIRPKMKPIEVFRTKGLPLFSKAVRKNKNPELYERIHRTIGTEGPSSFASNKCCLYLKEKPSMDYYNEHNIGLCFLGIHADESNNRQERWYGLGDIYWAESWNLYKAVPLIHFSSEDIWAYIHHEGLDISPHYSMGYEKTLDDGTTIQVCYERNGCWACGMGLGFPDNNLSITRHVYPKLYHAVMKKFGMGKAIRCFKANYDMNKWSEEDEKSLQFYFKYKPCYFDIAD